MSAQITNIAGYQFSEIENVEYKAKKKAARKAANIERNEKIVEGTIFYSSWGYEQTNVSFYQVVSKKGMSIKIRELKQERTCSGHNYTGKVIGLKDQFLNDKIISKRLTGAIKINSSEYLYNWDGQPKHYSSYH